ncbi:putative transcription factor PHD1 [Zancudomyces culisetae]|uniref:Putative transcription factor PHD1 n=1 Tax=Zancudomyces culisetae TaxID=1213189 RepID=A0A1R1PFR7_ZANCU|nr:putative transcription factor PHD1 [Zancudomyces culisetae]|eukprot:OMH79753.1 putative transcription factor PHD1 [Zancudomyces culisetae]
MPRTKSKDGSQGLQKKIGKAGHAKKTPKVIKSKKVKTNVKVGDNINGMNIGTGTSTGVDICADVGTNNDISLCVNNTDLNKNENKNENENENSVCYYQVNGSMGEGYDLSHLCNSINAMRKFERFKNQLKQHYPTYPFTNYYLKSNSGVKNIGKYLRGRSQKNSLTTTNWKEENTKTLNFEYENITVARRQDNNMINGTKLLNVTKMTRGKRDGILKAEQERKVIKTGSMYLKGVWITFERAKFLAEKHGIYEPLKPLFETEVAMKKDILKPEILKPETFKPEKTKPQYPQSWSNESNYAPENYEVDHQNENILSYSDCGVGSTIGYGSALFPKKINEPIPLVQNNISSGWVNTDQILHRLETTNISDGAEKMEGFQTGNDNATANEEFEYERRFRVSPLSLSCNQVQNNYAYNHWEGTSNPYLANICHNPYDDDINTTIPLNYRNYGLNNRITDQNSETHPFYHFQNYTSNFPNNYQTSLANLVETAEDYKNNDGVAEGPEVNFGNHDPLYHEDKFEAVKTPDRTDFQNTIYENDQEFELPYPINLMQTSLGDYNQNLNPLLLSQNSYFQGHDL